MSTPLAHLGEIRTRGWQILDELMKGKDAAQAIAAEGQWVLDLVTAVKPFSEWWAIKLGTTLSPTTDDEDDFAQDHLNKAAATNKRHCEAIRCHAVRLLRLDELFDEIKDGAVAAPSPQDEPAKAVAPAPKRPIAKSDVKALYKQHVEDTREAKGRKPTRAEDRKWRTDNDVRRPRLREFRAADRYLAQADGGTPRQK